MSAPSSKRDERKDALLEAGREFCLALANCAENGNPEWFKRMLDVYAASVRRWSHNNLVTILAQKPGIRRPVTIKEARALGHFPVKGTKAAFIFVPVIGGEGTPKLTLTDRVRALMDEYRMWALAGDRNIKSPKTALLFVEGHPQLGRLDAGMQQTTAAKLVTAITEVEKAERTKGKVLYFKTVPCVYDLGVDTAGPEISLSEVETAEQVGDLLQAMKGYAEEHGWSVSDVRFSLGEQGTASAGEIEVGEWLGEASQLHVLAHEIAHQQLHIARNIDAAGAETSEAQRELQAEAVAYAVSRHFGLKPLFSAQYIQSFGGTPKEIMANLAVICKAAREIITGVEQRMNREQVRTHGESEHEVEVRYYLGSGEDQKMFEDYQPLLDAIAQSETPAENLPLEVYVAGIGGSFYLDRTITAQEFVDQLFQEFIGEARRAQVDGFAFNDRGNFGIAGTFDEVPEELRASAVDLSENNSITI